MRLYLVEANRSDYDCFSEAVVYANSEEDACRVVQEEVSKPWQTRGDDLPGVWWELVPGATLSAKPVERKRGPVLGFGTAG